MQRREYVAGGLGLAALLAGGAYVQFGGSGTPDRVDPDTVETLGVGENEPETLTVPATDRWTVLEFFSRTCGECRKQVGVLESIRETAGSDVLFVSLHPESGPVDVEDPTALREMWLEHGGSWPAAIDVGDRLYRQFGTPGVPYTVVFEPGGAVAFAHMGVTSTEAITQVLPGTDR